MTQQTPERLELERLFFAALIDFGRQHRELMERVMSAPTHEFVTDQAVRAMAMSFLLHRLAQRVGVETARGTVSVMLDVVERFLKCEPAASERSG